MAQPAVSNLYKNWELESYMSTRKPSYLAGVLLKFPKEAEELTTLRSIVYGQDPMPVYGNRSVRSVTTVSRIIPPITMDTIGGLASFAANVPGTFKTIQNSTNTAGTATYAQVGLELVNPINGRVAKVTAVTINGVNDVDITVLATGATAWITAATTMPAGTTLVPMGVSVAEISDSVKGHVTDLQEFAWYLKEMRNSFPISGRNAAAGLIWVAPEKSASNPNPEGLFLNHNIVEFSKSQRLEANRQLCFADPDFTQFNTANPGWGGAQQLTGLFPMMLGRATNGHPGAFQQVTGGFVTTATLDSIARYNRSQDAECSKYMQVCDYEFSRKWSNLIRTEGGTFDLWEVKGIPHPETGGVIGLNLDFSKLVYAGMEFWTKELPIFSGGAGFNVATGLYKDVAFGLPVKFTFDFVNGEECAAIRTFYAQGDKGYSRLRNIWATGNPHLMPQFGGVSGLEAIRPGTPIGSHGRDEVSYEIQYEEGAAYYGMDQGPYVLSRA